MDKQKILEKYFECVDSGQIGAFVTFLNALPENEPLFPAHCVDCVIEWGKQLTDKKETDAQITKRKIEEYQAILGESEPTGFEPPLADFIAYLDSEETVTAPPKKDE